MKILHCIDSIQPSHGGTAEAVRQFCKMSGQNDFHMEVVCQDGAGTPPPAGFTVPVNSFDRGTTTFGICAALKDWLKENYAAYDAVIVHGIWRYHLIATQQALAGTNTPYFVFLHGMLNPWFRRSSPVKHLQKAAFWHLGIHNALRHATGILFLCEEERRLATQTFNLRGLRTEFAQLGLEPPAAIRAASPEAFFAKYPQLRGKRLLLFLGRICPMKAPELAIKALAKVSKLDPDLHLVVAGPEEDGWRKVCDEAVRLNHLEGKVTFTGPLYGEIKYGALRACDVFLLPSHCEAFPLALVEALACSCPVIISDNVNIWGDVQQHQAGFICQDNLLSLSDALQKWIALDATTRSSYRLRAAGCFRSCYDLGASGENLARVVRSHLPQSAVAHV